MSHCNQPAFGYLSQIFSGYPFGYLAGYPFGYLLTVIVWHTMALYAKNQTNKYLQFSADLLKFPQKINNVPVAQQDRAQVS